MKVHTSEEKLLIEMQGVTQMGHRDSDPQGAYEHTHMEEGKSFPLPHIDHASTKHDNPTSNDCRVSTANAPLMRQIGGKKTPTIRAASRKIKKCYGYRYRQTLIVETLGFLSHSVFDLAQLSIEGR
jgi:hypothetical protein